jgi:hypothetical protein
MLVEHAFPCIADLAGGQDAGHAGDDRRGAREPLANMSARLTHRFILHSAGDTVMSDSIF